MENNNRKKSNRNRGAMLVLSLCLVAGAAFTTFYTLDSAEKAKEEQQKLLDLNAETEDVAQETEKEEVERVNTPLAEADLPDDTAEIESEPETEEETESIDASAENAAADIAPQLNYVDTTPLTWPVAGSVILDYSMNGTIYFPTLNQYKYNPALIIGCDEGSQVLASTKGIVSAIRTTDELGCTVTLNLGNDYELVYGQLKELAVKEGDVLEEGTLIGYVSAPTKYYCEEGSNLYFEVKKDGAPTDPFLYLEAARE